jgi:hypothetical protein
MSLLTELGIFCPDFRQIWRAYGAGIHGILFAVKSAMNFLQQFSFFNRVVGIGLALSKISQFFASQLAFAFEFVKKLNDV